MTSAHPASTRSLADSRPQVFSIFPFLHTVGEEILRDHVHVRVASDPSPEALIAEAGESVALIGRAPARVGAEVFDALPELRLVFGTGSGADWCDLEAATARGIPVVNNPGIAPSAVSEYAIVAVVTALRRLSEAERHLRAGGGWEPRDLFRGHESNGRTLGIIGFGHIGRDVARRAKAGFDMHVVAFDPHVDGDVFRGEGVERVELDELLSLSDAVTVHVPLTEETRRLLGRRELAMMKRDAVLVNTSRGGVVDENALCQALATGHIRGAVVDVFENEPPSPDCELFGFDNVIVTPHVAGMTDEAMYRLTRAVASNVLGALAGERPPSVLNPSAWPPKELPSAPPVTVASTGVPEGCAR